MQKVIFSSQMVSLTLDTDREIIVMNTVTGRVDLTPSECLHLSDSLIDGVGELNGKRNYFKEHLQARREENNAI